MAAKKDEGPDGACRINSVLKTNNPSRRKGREGFVLYGMKRGDLRQLREAGLTYKVYKNTMMRFAFKDTDCEQLDDLLNGPSAIVVSKTDATAPAREIAKFAKTAPKLEFKGGIVEGTFYDAKGLESVAQVPSREELLSRLLGSMQSPITNFARVIKQIAEKGGEAAPAAE